MGASGSSDEGDAGSHGPSETIGSDYIQKHREEIQKEQQVPPKWGGLELDPFPGRGENGPPKEEIPEIDMDRYR